MFNNFLKSYLISQNISTKNIYLFMYAWCMYGYYFECWIYLSKYLFIQKNILFFTVMDI